MYHLEIISRLQNLFVSIIIGNGELRKGGGAIKKLQISKLGGEGGGIFLHPPPPFSVIGHQCPLVIASFCLLFPELLVDNL